MSASPEPQIDVVSENDQLLTSDQVLDRLMAHDWLRARAAACVLPAVRAGSEWRFRLSDLEAWIAEQRHAERQ